MRSDHNGVDRRTGPRHGLLLHAGGDRCLAALRPFLGDAGGEGRTLAVVTPPTWRLLSEALRDGATYIDVTSIGRNPGRAIPAITGFIEDCDSSAPVRVITEQWWDQRELAERAELARHEALTNLAFEGRDVALVCLYDTLRVRTEILADALATHPEMLDARGTRANAWYVDPSEMLAETEATLVPAPQAAEAVPVRPGRLAALRGAVRGKGRAAGLPAERVDDLVLAVNELATNVVQHGPGSGWLRMWSDKTWLIFEIVDSGCIDDPLVGKRLPGSADTNGRGLWMVNQLCDLVEMRSGKDGTTVRLRFKRPRVDAMAGA